VIDPIAFRLGPLSVHWYGIIIAAAVLLAGALGAVEARRRGEDPEVGWSMLLPVLVLAVIGARVYHVIHQWDYYAANPALIPQIWQGGLAITGAVVGGILGIWLYTRAVKLNTLRWFDIFATAVLLGQAIGRLGNFVNQELYGPPTDLSWGIPIDAQHRVGEWTNLALYPVETTRFVPLFAYEALLNLVGLVLILWIARRFAHRLYDGDILLIYLMWYGAIRTYLETYRVQNWVIAGVPVAIWIGVATFFLAGGLLLLRHARGWGTPGAWMRRSDETDADGGPPETKAEARAG
jgi:phosphatidylglycerol:prolipoprotein diacylglycerol transferase